MCCRAPGQDLPRDGGLEPHPQVQQPHMYLICFSHSTCPDSRAEEHSQEFGSVAVAELAAVAAADVMFMCLPTSAEVEQVTDTLLPKLQVREKAQAPPFRPPVGTESCMLPVCCRPERPRGKPAEAVLRSL